MSNEKTNISNLFSRNLDDDFRQLFILTFQYNHWAEKFNTLYKNDNDSLLAQKLISLYYKTIRPSYNDMLFSFKRKYIANEILIEKNDDPLQRKGINGVFDYLQNWHKDIEDFNILAESLKINCLLWKPTDDNIGENIEKEVDECLQMLEQAKKNKDIATYKKANNKLKELDSLRKGNKIGGQLRHGAEEVALKNVEILVPSGDEACKFINSLATPEKHKELVDKYNSDDILEYIEYCVKLTSDLIRYQPFNDGNKRTFRTLLNLLFKVKNVPPVYMRPKERDEWLRVLFKSIEQKDYTELVKFYYFKICDSIYELDVKPYLQETKNSKKEEQEKEDTKKFQ